MDASERRAQMVDRQLRRRGIGDERVLRAMGEVPRERFVTESARSRAYSDEAVAIGCGQTISQPWVVAAICQALELGGDERVLEIGTGSGYSACVLGLLAAEVVSIERVGELAGSARAALESLAVSNVEVIEADGTVGWPERAPYEGVAVHAAAPAPPRTLLAQLAPAGRLVVPVASGRHEALTVFTRRPDAPEGGDESAFERREIAPVRFVPLLGEEGFAER